MKNMNNQELLNSVENEILKHKENYSENQIKELIEIFNEIINVKTENADNIGDRYIDAIGNDHSGTYFFENVWTIDLLIKILENSSKNRARIIFCSSVLNDLYYFVLDDSDKFSKDEYWSEFRKVKKLLYPYSDKFYDGLLEKYGETVKSGVSLKEFLRRPKVTYEDIKNIASVMKLDYNLNFRDDIEYQIEVSIKYEGYIEKSKQIMEKNKKLEELKIPEDFDYDNMKGITREAKQMLNKKRPYNIGQASRILGVTPADISVLIMYLDGKLK